MKQTLALSHSTPDPPSGLTDSNLSLIGLKCAPIRQILELARMLRNYLQSWPHCLIISLHIKILYVQIAQEYILLHHCMFCLN